ncbi:MAG: DUF2868 domain-containing protein [Pseudomonadota bacterium]
MKLKATPYELGLMLKALEAQTGESAADAVALEAARVKSGNDEDKLTAYVMAHSKTHDIAEALRKAHRARKIATALLIGGAALLGALAVMSALLRDGDPALNIFWLLSALLGPATVALLVWGFVLLRSSGGLSSLWMGSLTGFMTKRFSPASAANTAATQVVTDQHIAGPLGRWRLSVLSHGFWLTYLISAGLVFVFIMAFQRYIFIWETTLLTTDQAMGLFSALRMPVAALGLPNPSVDEIRAAQYSGGVLPAGQVSQIWAQFTLALLLILGVLPRVLLWMASTWRVRGLLACQRLTATDPFFAGIAAQIYHPRPDTHIIDDDESPPAPSRIGVPAPHEVTALAAYAVIGWELDDEQLAQLGEATLIGAYEREDALISALQQSQSNPAAVAISLTNTPDRGTARILKSAAQQSQSRLTFILLGQSKLAQRFSKADQDRRLADWWALLMTLGISPENIILPEVGSLAEQGTA